jgi:hypothetical protein
VVKNFLQSNSQAHQESFVLNVLKEKTDGFYVELGGGWPIKNSNTYLLETEYNWSGISFENDIERAYNYNATRKNKTLCTDAISFDYLNYFVKNQVPSQIDYLQMDLHPAEDTLKALKNMPLHLYRFSVITYEHNGYGNPLNHNGSPETKRESEDILSSFGYVRVVENLKFKRLAFEDWWIDPLVVSHDDYKEFISKDIDHQELFNK